MLKGIKHSLLSVGKKIKGPIFIKDYADQSSVIAELEEIKSGIDDKGIKSRIDNDIVLIKTGDIGEQNV